MSKRIKSTWGLDLDLGFANERIAAGWHDKGFDTEDFFIADDMDSSAFLVGDEKMTEEEHECRYLRPRIRPVAKREVIYEKAASLSNELGLLNKGERIDVIMSGKFVLGDFIEAYMVEHNLHTNRLLISTLSYNENNIDSLKNLLDGCYVDRIDLIVSSYFYAHERFKLIKYAYQELDSDDGRFQLAVCNVHTKTYQFRTDEGLSIIMHGSGNMRAGANFEQMVVEENEEVFDFYAKFYDEIIREFPTIDKSKKFLKTWFNPTFDDNEG